MHQLGPNLLAPLPDARTGEVSETLACSRHVRIERIVSLGQTSPEGFWYDQPDAEWVMVAHGRARIEIEGQAGEIAMRPGDTLLLPAGCRHRVSWTDPAVPTVWIAVFFNPMD